MEFWCWVGQIDFNLLAIGREIYKHLLLDLFDIGLADQLLKAGLNDLACLVKPRFTAQVFGFVKLLFLEEVNQPFLLACQGFLAALQPLRFAGSGWQRVSLVVPSVSQEAGVA